LPLPEVLTRGNRDTTCQSRLNRLKTVGFTVPSRPTTTPWGDDPDAGGGLEVVGGRGGVGDLAGGDCPTEVPVPPPGVWAPVVAATGVLSVPPVVTTLARWTLAALPVGDDVAEGEGEVVGVAEGEVPVDPVDPVDGVWGLGRMAVLRCAAGERELTTANAPPRATTPAATATPALREIRDLTDPVG